MKVIFIGATGAVGTQCALALISRPEISQITMLVRTPHKLSTIADSPKVHQQTVDLSDASSYQKYIAGHELALSTLGIGEPSKVSKDEFLKIDFATVKNFAQECKNQNVKHFLSLGSVGADIDSKIFYLRVKGQLEKSLTDLQFQRLSLFRPSMIMTPTNRYGMTQLLALKFYPYLDPLLKGNWSKYHSVPVDQLGKAIALQAISQKNNSVEILTWQEMQRVLQTT